jgi:hypothetical protein
MRWPCAREIGEEGLRTAERLADRAVAQLEQVAVEHQAVDGGHRREQRRADGLARQHVGARAPAEVQVGDDERLGHGRGAG